MLGKWNGSTDVGCTTGNVEGQRDRTFSFHSAPSVSKDSETGLISHCAASRARSPRLNNIRNAP